MSQTRSKPADISSTLFNYISIKRKILIIICVEGELENV